MKRRALAVGITIAMLSSPPSSAETAVTYYHPSPIQQAYRSGQAASDNEAARAQYRRGIDLARAVLQRSPDDPDALLWLAANLGAEALTHGKLYALRVISQIESTLLHLERVNPSYDDAAAARSLANLYWKAPAIISIGSSKKASSYFDLALARAPQFPGNQALAAGFYLDQHDCGRARPLAQSVAARADLDAFGPDAAEWRKIVGDVLGELPVTGPRRILFVAEAVTLAQVVRLATLARALDPARYEIHFAAARFDDLVFADAPFTRHRIFSLTPELVDRRVAGGRRLYGGRTLARYVAEERALIAQLQPALVVGDLRLSLAVSAPLEGVPYAALINAYWSPRAERDRWPLPDHPIVRLLGVERAAMHFPKALPFVFRHFAAPVNRLRRAHGLPAIGDLPEVLTHGDHVLFPDAPGVTPVRALAARERYLGPVLWSPRVALPPWWSTLDPGRPTVYVTLGSSGRVQALPAVVKAAASLGLQVLVATAGRVALADLPAHVHVADYLPGELAARRAAVVISNGGSTTSYQALAEGRPILGLPFNLDQYLAMAAIETAGAGLGLRGGSVTSEQVRGALERLMGDRAFAARAGAARGEFGHWNAAERFRTFVEEAVTGAPAAAAHPTSVLTDTEPAAARFGAS